MPLWLDSSAPQCSMAGLHWSALCCPHLLCFALGRHLRFSSARETKSSVLGGKGKCALRARGELVYMDISPWPLIPDWSASMQMRTPNPHGLIGPIGIVLIGQNRASLVGWCCITLIGWGKLQSYWLK